MLDRQEREEEYMRKVTDSGCGTYDVKWVLSMPQYDLIIGRLTSQLAHHRHWTDQQDRLVLALVLFLEVALCR